MQAQRTTSPARQRGLSFIGVIFIGLLAVAAFAIGGQSVPIFIEYQAIKKAATTIGVGLYLYDSDERREVERELGRRVKGM